MIKHKLQKDKEWVQLIYNKEFKAGRLSNLILSIYSKVKLVQISLCLIHQLLAQLLELTKAGTKLLMLLLNKNN